MVESQSAAAAQVTTSLAARTLSTAGAVGKRQGVTDGRFTEERFMRGMPRLHAFPDAENTGWKTALTVTAACVDAGRHRRQSGVLSR